MKSEGLEARTRTRALATYLQLITHKHISNSCFENNTQRL